MTALAAALGAGVGVGLVVITFALHGSPVPRLDRISRPLRALPRRLAIAGICGIIGGLLTGWPVAAVLIGAAGAAIPAALRRYGIQRRSVDRVEAIAAWADMLRDTMAGAAGLESALVATASMAPLAIRAEARQLAANLTRQPLRQALREFSDSVADPTCDLVVAALLMAAEHQGRQLGELLGALAVAAREETAMRLRVEAERARIRSDLQIIVLTVVGFMAVLLFVDRAYYAPYDSPTGQLVLAAVSAVFVTAFLLLLRLARGAPAIRLLSSDSEERQ